LVLLKNSYIFKIFNLFVNCIDKVCEMWIPSSLVDINMTNEDSAQIEDCKLSDDRTSVNGKYINIVTFYNVMIRTNLEFN
jgi:hypothetical protein